MGTIGMFKVGITTILLAGMVACTSDTPDRDKLTLEAITEVERIEYGTKACIETTKNKNSTPISIMATCQLAMTRYSSVSISSVAEMMYYLPEEYQLRLIATLKELESALIVSKELEYEYAGNQYVETVVREQRLAADMIQLDATTVKDAEEASKKME